MQNHPRTKDNEVERVLFKRHLDELQAKLGYSFGHPELLRTALTHSSYVQEDPRAESYERLEFLGDRVIELTTCKWLYCRYRDADEGLLSKHLAWIGDEDNLARLAERLGLKDMIRVGSSMNGQREHVSQSMLADAIESVMGAIYLDGGHAAAERVVLSVVLEGDDKDVIPADFLSKNSLQEYCQGKDIAPPSFVHVESGPDHDKKFTCTVAVKGLKAVGIGSSKKEAERRAAAEVLEMLRKNDP
ncbi:MAG TPA: ribonuclease III [Methanomassiliicoccales archaeon]|nr:ribonuclease III [Methanomassiliicoccales archaeon]